MENLELIHHPILKKNSNGDPALSIVFILSHKIESTESFVPFIKQGVLTFEISAPNGSEIKSIRYELEIVHDGNHKLLTTVKGNVLTSTVFNSNLNDIESKQVLGALNNIKTEIQLITHIILKTNVNSYTIITPLEKLLNEAVQGNDIKKFINFIYN